MIINMKRLTLVAHKADEQAILHVLQPLEAVEVLPNTETAVDFEQLSEAEERVQSLKETLEALKPYGQKKGLLSAKPVKKLTEIAAELPAALEHSEQVYVFQRELARIRSEIEKNNTLIESLQPWEAFPAEMESCANSKHVRYFLGLIDSSEVGKIAGCEAQIEYQLFEGQSDNPITAVLIACAPDDAKDVAAFLKTLEWTDFAFPKLSGTPKAAMNRLRDENNALHQEQKRYIEHLAQKGNAKEVIEDAYDAAVIERDRLAATASLRKTAATFELEGWVPEDRIDAVEKAIQSVTDAYYLCTRVPNEDETPPSVVRNNSFVEPFEAVTNLYSRPDPKGIDATPYMTPFYVLLFGLMLSDTGYGLLLVIGCWLFNYFKKPEGMMGGIAKVLFWGGFSTIVWGLLTGTVFGMDFDVLFGTDCFPLLIDPMTDPIGMLILCFGLGVLHILFGLYLKIKMSFASGDWQTAVFDNVSWILIILGLITYAVPLVLDGIPAVIGTVGMIAAIIGAVMILLFKGREKKNIFSRTVSGLGELYQITSYLSDILSYARLFALGIATGVIAQVFNDLCMMLMGSPNIILKIAGFLVAVALLVALHLFNLAINTLGAFVHCARLQYVEFYGKFYEAGGVRFKPLGYDTKYVQLSDIATNN